MEIDFTTNRWSRFFAAKGRMAILYLVFIAGILFVSLWHLGRAAPGFSPSEQVFVDSTSSIHKLIDNPLYAPLKAGQYLLHISQLNTPVMMRLISVTVGLAALVCFYLLIRHWHTRRMALIATALMGGSSWFLSISRAATPDILFVAMPLALICVNYFSYRRERVAPKTVFMVKVFTTIIALYVPTMIWFVLIIDAMYFRQLKLVWKKLPNKEIVIGLLTLAVGITPLVYSFVKDIHILQLWAGLPTSLLTPKDYGVQLTHIVLSVGYKTVFNPGIRLATTPLLDIMSSIFLCIGLYSYWLKRHAKITTVLLVMGLTSVTVLTLTNGADSGPLALLLPFVYINIAAGATLLLQQWFRVFPKNNIARGIGVFLLCALVSLGVFFHFQKYFVAWPQNPDTSKIFDAQ